MGSSLVPHVRASNALTGRWCATFGDGDAVVSGAGLWPLLALLAGAASGRARDELAAVVGVVAEQAHAAGLDMLKSLDTSREVSTAIGVWFRAGFTLRADWVRSMPTGTVGELGDRAALDAWAQEQTRGLITKFPVPITADTVLALATALQTRTRWAKPFDEIRYAPETGPWQGHRGTGLYRTSSPDRSVSVLDDDVTRVIVRGAGELDVHLLVGADPRHGIATGLAALAGTADARTDLPVGTTAPCLSVSRLEAFGGDAFVLKLPPFDIDNAHDLTRLAPLFGLTTAMDHPGSHFDGLAAEPLVLDAAGQNVMARFDAAGFEAAAVTAVAMAPGGGLPQKTWSTITSVDIDRPFGFLAVDRPTGLVLVAGQVTKPPVEWVRSVPDASAAGRKPGPPW
ncbi:serpin family protein [Nocardia alba]|uniref:Serine protease inhibitor n=1 Tax=Nocardia alba TaxID=225051 RepID=A0A4R1FKZ1_9NOCA|nr:serpin family protein [Nocardia alba]TCJ95123.1 serine protease inhibitor [Nocardia alba]